MATPSTGPPRRTGIVLAVVALLIGVLTLAGPSAARVMTGGWKAVPKASATHPKSHHQRNHAQTRTLEAAPNHVAFTLEGCRNDGTISLPNGSGKYICPDAAYTTGNLGKNW